MKPIVKSFLARALAVLLLAAPLILPAAALEADELVPIGRTAGIKLYADGVIVTDFSELRTPDGYDSPARRAGLQPGDIITHCNGQTIKTADALADALAASLGEAELTVLRGGKTISCRVVPARDSSGVARIGALVRDSLAGIGTITFYDPTSGTFGALGHGICESETGVLVPIDAGALIPAVITEIRRGAAGKPGELVGSFDLTAEAGELGENLDTGLYGKIGCNDLYPELLSAAAIPVAEPDEVRRGAAEILANVSGDRVERFAVEITEIELTRETKNFVLRVTDPALLARTGGIVQGMSGSPILQNGKLIGAVTHVLVNDPAMGYGIFIENMLNAA